MYKSAKYGSGGKSRPRNKQKPIPLLILHDSPKAKDPEAFADDSKTATLTETQHTQAHAQPTQAFNEDEAFKLEMKRFIEISKFFSSPLRKSASYRCENQLVTYPSTYKLDYKRGCLTNQRIKLSNITLGPVFVKLFKVIPDIEQLKITNISLLNCQRIPPGLSFHLNLVYHDITEKLPSNAKVVFVASRKTSTPCYQVCEIDLQIQPIKARAIPL